MERDHMEYGNTGLFAREDGTYFNKDTNEILNAEGEVIGHADEDTGPVT